MPRYNLVMEAKNNVGVAISTQPTYAWEFRDATGSAVVNDWVSGVAATPSGATSTSEGMTFNGTSDYVDLTSFQTDGTLSIEVYVRWEGSSGTTARIFDWDSARLILGIESGDTLGFYTGDSGNHTYSTTAFFSSAVTVHIVITYDGTDTKMYVNNVLEGTSSVQTINTTTRANMSLGKDFSSVSNLWNGTISYFRIWNGTALSASDVQTLYANRESKAEGFDFNVCGKSALTVAQGGAEVAGGLSVGGGATIDGNVGIGTTSPQSLLHVRPPNNTADQENLLLDFRGDFTGGGANHGHLGIYATETHTNGVAPDLRFKGSVYNGSSSPTLNEVICLKPTGYVGIGTTSPGSLLHVVETGTGAGSVAKILIENEVLALLQLKQPIPGNIKEFNIELGRTDGDLTFRSLRGEKMRITEDGYVGIGTSPSYPLHVTGTAAPGPAGSGGYLSTSGPTVSGHVITSGPAASGVRAASIYSQGAIISGADVYAYSDERIKKNIVDLSDNEALETLRLIQPKKYEYVDQISRTNKPVYGYIAQQIQEVLPYAVGEVSDAVPNIYNLADISSEIVYTEAPDISAVSIVGISILYVDVSNVNTSAEVSMNVVMVEQSDISQNAVFSEAELEDGTKVHKLTFNDGYNTASLHESSNILRVMDASNQEYHITITNIETSYRLEIEEDLSGLVNAQGELFVAGQRVPQNVYKLVFPAFDTATLDASSTTLKLVDASDVTQYVSIASVLDSSTLQIDDDLQYMALDSSNQLFVYGQKVSKSLTSLTFDGSYNVSSISENLISLKVLDTSGQPHDVNVYSKESESNRLLLDEDISGKISYGASGELFVQGQNMNTIKHILTIQNYDTANLDASSTTLCLYDISNVNHEVSIVSVIDGSNIEISKDPTSFAHEGQVFVYGQKVDDFHALSKEYINVVTLSAVQELDRALTKVTQEKDELQTKYDALETKYDALQTEVTDLKALLTTNGVI
ncbi:MAG: hypothetical protein CMD99_04180 [Gammaproteobacteria bacterium]|nr:hypothetical protein [Gammaproteobacteria bacterium]